MYNPLLEKKVIPVQVCIIELFAEHDMEPSIIVKILLLSDIDDKFDKIWNENVQQQKTQEV